MDTQAAARHDDTIEIRALRGHAERRAAEELQLAVWGPEPIEVVPDHMLLAAQTYGGTLIGAFAHGPGGGRLVGFVFGIAGLKRGRPVHYSHLAAVLPAYRDAGLGRRLKLAQRDAVLAQGVDRICWTYDPLQSRNARLNLRRLGAACRTYDREVYGEMRDALNVALPSDRFTVDWWLASRHVARRLAGDTPAAPAELLAAGVPLLNPPSTEGLPGAPPDPAALAAPRALAAVPADLEALRASTANAALRWRLHTRALFEAAFAAGYTAVDLLAGETLSYYLLEKDWDPDGD